MTGTEHYREAERLIANVEKLTEQLAAGDGPATWRGEELNAGLTLSLRLAQIHATLAVADSTDHSNCVPMEQA